MVRTPSPLAAGVVPMVSADLYSTTVYYWAGEPRPDLVDAFMEALDGAGWARTVERELPVAAAVLAFSELFPDKVAGWHGSYPELFQRVGRAMSKPLEDSSWNGYYLVQWFLLRMSRKEEGIEIIDKLLDREASGGEVGYDTRAVLGKWSEQCKPFEVAVKKARARRLGQMLVTV